MFCDTWAQSVNDVSRLAKDTDAACHGRVAAEKQAYMSLPKPGVTADSLENLISNLLLDTNTSCTDNASASVSVSSSSVTSASDSVPVDTNGNNYDACSSSSPSREDPINSSTGPVDNAKKTSVDHFEQRMSMIIDDLHQEMDRLSTGNGSTDE